MAEQTEGSILVEAPAAEIMDVLTDYEAYPEWADVKTASVLERGEGGVGTRVAFEVEVPILGRASYTLAYRYAPADGGMSWVSTEARGAVSDISGEYLLSEIDDDVPARADTIDRLSRFGPDAIERERRPSIGVDVQQPRGPREQRPWLRGDARGAAPVVGRRRPGRAARHPDRQSPCHPPTRTFPHDSQPHVLR